MNCKKCGNLMYHVERNNMDGYFLEAYTCSDCNLVYEIKTGLSGKMVDSKWIDLNEKVEASE